MYERNRRVIFTARMLAVNGKIQREGDVVHVVANQLFDFSSNLAAIGNIDAFPLSAARGDEVAHCGSIDQKPMPNKPTDIYIPDLHIDTIKVKTRDFR